MDKSPSLGELMVQLVLALIGVAAMVWAEMPAWQRQIVTARIRHELQRALSRVALRSGRRAMRDELEGRERQANDGYRFTRKLSELRDKL